jgi:hypothetical protein
MPSLSLDFVFGVVRFVGQDPPKAGICFFRGKLGKANSLTIAEINR